MMNAPFEVLGVILKWQLRGSETGNQYCALMATVPPGAMVPPHQHREQEAFFMIEGTGEFAHLEDGNVVWKPVNQGEMINFPSDEVHGFRNSTGQNIRCLITAHSDIEGFFLEAGTPLEPASGPPTSEAIERVLTIARKHGQRFLQPS